MNTTLQDFASGITPHGLDNGHPPSDATLRHQWETKQLYTIIDVLKDDCAVLDYGCGKYGTLRHTLFGYAPNATYYGLDVQPSPEDEANAKFGHIDTLEDVLPKVNGAVLGSVFTHLSWEGIQNMLDKTLPYYDNGFQIGFTAFLSDKYETYKPGWYGAQDTFWVTKITEDMLSDYCTKNNLQYVVHPYVQNLDHRVMDLTHQSFVTIKKA